MAHAARVGCYQYLCCDGLLPASIQGELGTLPGAPRKPLLQPQASQAGPCPQRHSGRLALHKAGTGGQPAAASPDGHHLGWRLRAGWQLPERAGLAAPPPPGPGTAPARASGFSGRQRGVGRPGWASGLGRRLPSLGPGSSRLPPKHKAGGEVPGLPTAGLSTTVTGKPRGRPRCPPQSLEAFLLCASGSRPCWPLGLCTGCAPCTPFPPAPCLPHSHKSLCGSLESFRPHPKSHLLGASLPPHSSIWGFPPPCPSPHSAPALFSCPCSWSLNCKLSVSGSPTRLHTPLHPCSR